MLFLPKFNLMKLIYSLILFFSLFNISAQSNYNNSVPTFYESDKSAYKSEKKKDIVFKTLEFITQKTDSLFLKRMKLKENDSIEFQVSYVIDRFGFVEKDSTIISTPIDNFNNYMKLIINMLPRFTPAIGEDYKPIPYKVAFLGKFHVKNNKLNHFQYEVDKYFLIDLEEIPIFPGCENTKNALDCFNQKMSEHIKLYFRYPRQAAKNNIQGRVSIQFVINEFGKVEKIETRGPNNGKLLEDEAYRIISLLPKFKPGIRNGKNVSVKYGLPINFILN